MFIVPLLLGQCSNDCVALASNGFCNDGGPGALFSSCDFGADCDDCGHRTTPPTAPPPSPPPSPPPPSPPPFPPPPHGYYATGCVMNWSVAAFSQAFAAFGNRNTTSTDDAYMWSDDVHNGQRHVIEVQAEAQVLWPNASVLVTGICLKAGTTLVDAGEYSYGSSEVDYCSSVQVIAYYGIL